MKINWGKPKQAPYLSLIQENRHTYVCMFVCVVIPNDQPTPIKAAMTMYRIDLQIKNKSQKIA